MTAITVAIDGPSGSGKSSVSRAVATTLGLTYLDTGAMFRAVTLWCLRQNIDLSDGERVARVASDIPLEMVTDPLDPHVLLDGDIVDDALRSAELSARVSAVATNLLVRAHLADLQRQIIASARLDGPGIVVEGRDITTKIAPEAEHRILLSASEESRLARRGAELEARGDAQGAADIHDQVVRRDRDDATVSNFREAAPGVHGIDTSPLTFKESVAAVLRVIDAPSRPQTNPKHQPSTPGGQR